MRTSDIHTSANTALREATLALSVRRHGTDALTETNYQALAADLAATLDAVANLLLSVGIGVRPNATTRGLLTVAEHLGIGALMARQASGDHNRPAVPRMRLDPERCATTEE